ncbi:hypothetical protein [Leifsonia poae]|uniref:Uncharacterized protein n=1 Tax=Leifsonia poae TaxID=110933 RepID=A0A9W6HD43_9MICO|nr:hypothetical protein [Leifsonia poae]GLJ78097.1 hypothetical protein GCM10017584_36710 [Leifsonia poae]
MNTLASTLHDATHSVPGVPAHSDAPAANQPHRNRVRAGQGNRGPRLQNNSRRHHTPPRILISWQNWIGRLVGRGDR